MRIGAAMLACTLAAVCACAPRVENASFPSSTADAKSKLRAIQADRQPLERPLVVLGGFMDPGAGPAIVSNRFRELFDDDDRIIDVSFVGCRTFDECRDRVIRAVDETIPSVDASATAEVDVIGLSMGGLVGRYAAAPIEGRRRLNVARLFTVSSPHRGALKADLPGIGQMHRDMRAGSAFLRELEAIEMPRRYELVPYVRLADTTVGPENAAPHGVAPWWLDNEPLQPSHVGAASDPRILADIALRLRGETPLTLDPPAPLPAAQSALAPRPEP